MKENLFRELRKTLSAFYDEGEAQAIAFFIMEKRCGLTRTDVVVGKGDELPEERKEELRRIAERVGKGEPVQYVTGEADFCGYSFRVEPGVLIPRPETEELVEWAVQVMDEMEADSVKRIKVADIGTGSGCIAVTLAKRKPLAEVEAWDISEKALRVAADNVTCLQAKVTLMKRDALAPLQADDRCGSYSLIVSNPPYICENERKDMERNVLEHEPELALFVPDEDPLLFYRAITEKAAELLCRDGRLLFEVNRKYAGQVAELMRKLGFTDVEVRRDFMGNERMVGGRMQGVRNGDANVPYAEN